MAGLFPSRTLSVAISREPAEVYAFVTDPRNLPRWATQFAKSVQKIGEDWVVQTPDGQVTIRFAPRNELGVLDHVVRLASGQEVAVPMRVVANGTGSEVLFTLLRLPGMSDEHFAHDAAMVEQDLQTLKRVMEGSTAATSS